MKYDWIDEYLLAKKGTEKNLQPEWNWLRYCLGGKMYAAVCMDGEGRPVYITLKLEPGEGEFLRGQHEDIIPGYYMNKEHWNSVKAEGAVPNDLLREMLDKSYSLILKGFSRKKQKELLGEGE
ncbi:MAG: MmcQ/YjbR family DNA-binding protein [Oscillospiraceae bacterium]|nr:MmcQ/YjbR family DNA-binding protein [Oscillospiraceae bacterium]